MKIFIIITVLLTILASSGYYVYTRITQAFTGSFTNSKLFLVAYIFIILSWILGKIIEHYSINIISISLIKIGSIGLSYFIYALLFVIFIDFIRLINHFIPFFPSFITDNLQKARLITGIISLLTISILITYGYTNARIIKVKNVNITINKSKASFDTLNVVAISDIHLGITVNNAKTLKLIEKINELNPDLVIIAGDIIDDNIKVVQYYKLLEHFKNIDSKYGVYSCLGNHEYISGAYKNLNYLDKNGIKMLRDTTIKIDDKFYIISRDDIEGERHTNKKRKDLKELTKDIDFSFPVFLLDHQPFKLEKTAEHPIDLQFSGHTHNGQIWPFNYITGLLFEEDWGYLKKNNTHFYISSGFGTAVVPLRIGNSSEIVNFKIINTGN